MNEGTSTRDASSSTTWLDHFNARLLEYSTPHRIEVLRESCIFNVISHGAMGFVFGGALGLFLSGMSSAASVSPPEAHLTTPQASVSPNNTVTISQTTKVATAAAAFPIPTSVPVREQVRLVFKDMASRTWRSARSFALIGALFSGFECSIEGYRAKHDVGNTIGAGCLTGAVLGARAGPKSAAMGCVGFAAFSTAMEYFLQDNSRNNNNDGDD